MRSTSYSSTSKGLKKCGGEAEEGHEKASATAVTPGQGSAECGHPPGWSAGPQAAGILEHGQTSTAGSTAKVPAPNGSAAHWLTGLCSFRRPEQWFSVNSNVDLAARWARLTRSHSCHVSYIVHRKVVLL